MAVTITQQPTTPNAAYTRLVYVLSGSVTTSNPQYQYVMDVYESGSSEYIARVTQTPNPYGVAVFDPSKIIQGELSEDQFWKVPLGTGSVDSSKTFDIKFGEQYGTSLSSSITVYPDLTNDILEIIPAVVDPNNGVSYNFQSGSYLPSSSTNNIELSNDPLINETPAVYKPVGLNDYQTISYINNGTLLNIDITLYSGDNVLKVSTGNTPSISSDDNLIYVGTGPQNIIDYDGSFEYFFTVEQWSHYKVTVNTTQGPIISYYVNEAINPSISQEVLGPTGDLINTQVQPIQYREKVRFAFINKYGVWDYYNNYNPVQINRNNTKQNVTTSRVDYSDISSIYNVSDVGETVYSSELRDSFSVQTAYLDKRLSNWLEELLESPSVFIQRGNDFIPIVITNTGYVSNTNEYRQKLFQYTIEFEPANQPILEWIPEYITQECPDFVYKAIYEACGTPSTTLDMFSSSSYLFPASIYDGQFCYYYQERGGNADYEVEGFTDYSDCVDCDNENFSYIFLGYSVPDPTCSSVYFLTSTYEEIKCALLYAVGAVQLLSGKYRTTDGLQVGSRLYNSNNTVFSYSGNLTYNLTFGPPQGGASDAVQSVTGGKIITVDGNGYITAITDITTVANCYEPYSVYKSTWIISGEYLGTTRGVSLTYNQRQNPIDNIGVYAPNSAVQVWASIKPCDYNPSAEVTLTGPENDGFTGAWITPPGTYGSYPYYGTKDVTQNAPYATEYKRIDVVNNDVTTCGDLFTRTVETNQSYCGTTPYLDYTWRYLDASDTTGTFSEMVNYTGDYTKGAYFKGPLRVGDTGNPPQSNQFGYRNPKTGTTTIGLFNSVNYRRIRTEAGDFLVKGKTSGAVGTTLPIGEILDLSGSSYINTSASYDPGMYTGPYFWRGTGVNDPYRSCVSGSVFAPNLGGPIYIEPETNLDTVYTGSGFTVYTGYNPSTRAYSNPFDGQGLWYRLAEWNPGWRPDDTPDTDNLVKIDATGSIIETMKCADTQPTYYKFVDLDTSEEYRTYFFSSSVDIGPTGSIWYYNPGGTQYGERNAYWYEFVGTTNDTNLPGRTFVSSSYTERPPLYPYLIGNKYDTLREATYHNDLGSTVYSPEPNFLDAVNLCGLLYRSNNYHDRLDTTDSQSYFNIAPTGSTIPEKTIRVYNDDALCHSINAYPFSNGIGQTRNFEGKYWELFNYFTSASYRSAFTVYEPYGSSMTTGDVIGCTEPYSEQLYVVGTTTYNTAIPSISEPQLKAYDNCVPLYEYNVTTASWDDNLYYIPVQACGVPVEQTIYGLSASLQDNVKFRTNTDPWSYGTFSTHGKAKGIAPSGSDISSHIFKTRTYPDDGTVVALYAAPQTGNSYYACQDFVPSISNVTTYNLTTGSVELAATGSDNSAYPTSQSAIIHQGFYVGLDSSSATNNPIYSGSIQANYEFTGSVGSLDGDTTYYAWGYVSNIYNEVTSSRVEFTTTKPVYSFYLRNAPRFLTDYSDGCPICPATTTTDTLVYVEADYNGQSYPENLVGKRLYEDADLTIPLELNFAPSAPAAFTAGATANNGTDVITIQAPPGSPSSPCTVTYLTICADCP